MTTDTRGHTVPATNDHPSRQGWVLGPLLSVRDPIPVANATARAALIVALAALSPAIVPSTANPVFIFRADAAPGSEIEYTTNGTSWTTMATSAGSSIITPASVAGAGASLSGAAVILAGASSVNVNGVFGSLYDNYLLLIKLSATSAATDLVLYLRAGGADLTSPVYMSSQQTLASGTPSYVYYAAGNQGMIVGRSNGAGGGSSKVDLLAPARAEFTGMLSASSDAIIWRTCGGTVQNNASCDGFTLTTGSGATMTGAIHVYGYAG
jgi:hypothetical protein